MRGTVQKKGKKWYAVIYDGVNPATGNYRRRWVQAGTRRGDAEKLLAELVKRAHRGETVVSEKLTLEEYLRDRWLPIQESRVRPSTLSSYRRNIELHVIPGLGKRQLDQLSADDIDLFYAGLLKNGRKKRPGRLLSAELLALATTPQAVGACPILGEEVTFGLGFQPTTTRRTFGPMPRSFGHFGTGGALGFADPDSDLAFGYVMNHVIPRWQSSRNRALVDAVYRSPAMS